MTVSLSLSPELENFLNEKVSSGEYNSPGDVLGNGLRLLQDQEVLQEADREHLRREIQKGIDCIARGEYTEHTKESSVVYVDKVMAEAKRRWEAKQAEGIK